MSDEDNAMASAPRRAVLYIEDNAANQLLVQRVFAHRPEIDLICAERGLLGLEMARDQQPALVLLDIHLPDINGDRVLQRLRDDPLTRAIPVVVLSADASDFRIQSLLMSGAWAYLTKPLDLRRLLEVVDEILSVVTPADSRA